VEKQEAIITRHKCDICGFEGPVAYIPELDKWYCSFCLETVVALLEACSPEPSRLPSREKWKKEKT
jgi:hypothetical protein